MRSNILKWTRGVTLVELMVVVALIAIIAAIASPGISRGIERANARSAASEVASLLRSARNQAMSRGVPVWVSVTLGDASSRGTVRVLRATNTPALRSCREVTSATWEIVAERSMDEFSGQVGIRGIQPAGQNNFAAGGVNGSLELCFNPDGRAMASNGRLLSSLPMSGAAQRCVGEDSFLWLARMDETPGADHLNCVAAGNRAKQRDDRDIIHFFKVSVPFNGNIRVEQ